MQVDGADGSGESQGEGAQPAGRVAVTEALLAATMKLLTEKGSSFSVREAADLAGVNQGLIYRHFGSKEQLIAATTLDLTNKIAKALAEGRSPLKLIADDYHQVVTVLARLVLDDAGSLVDEHPGIAALTEMAVDHAPDNGPSASTRVVVAGSAVLGWVLFSEYLTKSADGPVDSNVGELYHALIDQLLMGEWPVAVNED